MRKSILLALLFLFVLLLLLLGVVAGGAWYLSSDRVKTVHNLEAFGGGSLSVGAISLSDIWEYPEIRLTVNNLHVWEGESKTADSAFLAMEQGRVHMLADLFNSDSILLREITYCGGHVRLVKDAQQQTAAERMRSRKPEEKSRPFPYRIVASPDLVAGIEALEVQFSNPSRGKKYAGFIQTAKISEVVLDTVKHAVVDFDVQLEGLTFKAADGAYGKNTRVQGTLDFWQQQSKLIARIPDLLAGTTAIDFSAEVRTSPDSMTSLTFDVPAVDLPSLRPLLAPGLQEKLADYDVRGLFPATVKLHRNRSPGSKIDAQVEFQLRGNTAFVDGYTFERTYLNGTFYNRLPAEIGHSNPQRLGSTFVIDTVSTYGLGFDLTSAHAVVVAEKAMGARLRANVSGKGPAKALSELLKSDQYLFTSGTVHIEASIDGPLSETTRLLDQSDGQLTFTNPSIRLVDAGVELPLKHLSLNKQGNAASVALEGFTLSAKHAFQIAGEVQGISRIIGGQKPEAVNSQVKVTAKHLSWEDLAAYLGTSTREDTADVDTTSNGFDPESLKKVLRSIEASFQPQLDIVVDTLSYQDIALTTFHTGLHFKSNDTLILERTSFLLDTANVSFGGSLVLGRPHKTPYQFSLNARHVDVEDLLPKLNYLGLNLLRDLNSLPNDVDMRIEQSGYIDDQQGILRNASSGYIDLVSNKQQAFRARVDFEPDRPNEPAFNSTVVNIQGNASLFNDFFDTEEFLFQDGDFDFFMAYAGLIPDLRTLVENEEMSLDLRNGQVLFKSADLEIPINSLTLDMLRDTAEVRLFLRSEELGQELRVDGVANNLSEVVLGEAGKQFSTDASVVSERIVWKDLNALIGSFAGEKDTTAELNLRKTTRAIMMKFRPNIHLRIDELQLNNRLAILDVESGLRMDDNQRLHVDTTGFIYGNGSVKLAGSIDLKRLELTPFDLYLNTEELDLASLLEGFDHFGITSLKETETLEGKMSLELNLDGDILGDGGNFVSETASGVMSFSFFDLQVDGLTQIDELAKRFKISNRLDNLKFAPVTNIVTLDTNTIHLPLMEIPSSAFRVFVEGDMSLGESMDFWVSVPLVNLITPDSTAALQPTGYATHKFKVHVEFAKKGAEEDLETKLRLSRRKFYKQRQDLGTWKANRKYWKEERKRLKKAGKN